MDSDYSLRSYQQNAVDFVEDQMVNNDVSSAIIVRPTGTGKTIIMSSIIEDEINRGGRVLLLAHRNKLLKQAHDKLMNSCGIDASYEGIEGGDSRVMICSIQSMSRDARLSSYSADSFAMILVDETHHIASLSYQKVIDYFSSAKLIGVTATPVRSDGTDTTELFDVSAPEYTTKDAIKDGYLSPFFIQKAPISIDISNVHIQAGDYSAGELGSVLDRYLSRIARTIEDKAKSRKIVIFVPLVATAQKLAGIFNTETSLRAEYVSGARKDSDDVLDKFEAGEYDVICNSMLLTEGWDCPSVDCIINLRPTKSRGLYTQIIGRGLRIAKDKDYALILDFLWKDDGRGHLNAQDVFEEPSDEYEKQAIDELIADSDVPVDIRTLKEKAQDKAQALREAALAEALELANGLNREREEQVKKREELNKALFKFSYKKFVETGIPMEKINAIQRPAPNVAVRYNCASCMILSVKIDDPAVEAFGLGTCKVGDASWEQDYVSNGQISFAQKMGLPKEYLICKGQASALIDEAVKRHSAGLATYKQLSILARFGLKDLAGISQKQAGEIMNNHHNYAQTRYHESNGHVVKNNKITA